MMFSSVPKLLKTLRFSLLLAASLSCVLTVSIQAQDAPASNAASTTNDATNDKKVPPPVPLQLGVGDLVELSVYNVPELSSKTRVSSSGDLYCPLVGYT